MVYCIRFNVNHLYPSTDNVLNLQQCMNYMVSTYNDRLLTNGAAMFSAPAAVAAPTEGAAEAAQRPTKIRQRLRKKHTKRKPLLSQFLKNTALWPPGGSSDISVRLNASRWT